MIPIVQTPARRFLQKFVRIAQPILLLLAVILLWRHVAPMLFLLVLALLLSSILSPLADWLETRFGGSRVLGVLGVYVAMVLVIVGLASQLGPVIVSQAGSMVSAFQGQSLEDLTVNLKESVVNLAPESMRSLATERIDVLAEKAPTYISRLVSDLAGMIFKLASVLGNLVLVLFFTFILMLEAQNFKVKFVRAIPNAYFEMALNTLDKINAQVSGYLRGQAIIAITDGVIWTLGLLALIMTLKINLPYFVIIGMLAGLANLIPFFGPFVGVIVAAGVYLMTPQDGGISGAALAALGGLFLLVLMVDNFLVQPRVMSASVGIHPIVVVVVVMIGGSLMGPMGMLFAVPAFGVIRVTVGEMVWGLRAYRIL